MALTRNSQGHTIVCTKCHKEWWTWYGSINDIYPKLFVCNWCNSPKPETKSERKSLVHSDSYTPDSFVHNACMAASVSFPSL